MNRVISLILYAGGNAALLCRLLLLTRPYRIIIIIVAGHITVQNGHFMVQVARRVWSMGSPIRARSSFDHFLGCSEKVRVMFEDESLKSLIS